MQQTYKNFSGNSGVKWFDTGLNFVIICFKEASKGMNTYKYTYEVPGADHVEEMKKLASLGRGLNSYIGKHLGKNAPGRKYESKWFTP